ncbi:rootletin-like, partial [Notothenia coriiceps]|uniref:Rootletin-like n=1 Tax=Notothenia coriiceps TaxID=8208 RepID=A0A6I9MTF7_9TELE
AEKGSLEAALFESQELASSLEAQCTRKEGERRSLLLANEALTRDAARMREDGELRVEQAVKAQTELEKKLAQMERKTLLTLNNTEQLHREQLEAECHLKEQEYAELTIEREQAGEQLRRQCEEQLRRQCEEQRALSQKELQQVQEEVARLQQDFNQSLLQAECEKQQALSQKEAEKAALTEKLAALQQELATAGKKLECMQREARNKHEQNKNATAVHWSELHDLRSQFEESLNSHENAKSSLSERKELYQLREHTQQELEGLRWQLQEAKDGLIKAQTELMEAHRELQECVQERDKQRKEALDLRRLMGDGTREKEAIQASNQELRAFIKRAESDNNRLRRAFEERDQKVSVSEECRNSMLQEVTTLRSSLRELEKSRLQARRNLQELRRQVKVLKGEDSRKKQELRELQALVCQEEQKEEEARREAFSLRQRVLECEAGREAALNEVDGLQLC